MISKPPIARVFAPFVVVAGLLLLSSCGSDGDAVASLTSGERAAEDVVDEEPGGSGDVTEYCDRAQHVADSSDELSDDPAAGLEHLDALRSVAPGELSDDFDVLAGVLEQLSALDEDDPASIAQAMSIVFDPEVLAASEAISTYTMEECGIDLDASGSDDEASDDTTGSGSSGGEADDDDAADPTEVELEDIDAIKEASTGTWADKLSGSVISGGVDVQVSAMEEDLLTSDEALAACTELLAGLAQKNPAVSVEVLSGSTSLVAAPAGGTCAPV